MLRRAKLSNAFGVQAAAEESEASIREVQTAVPPDVPKVFDLPLM